MSVKPKKTKVKPRSISYYLRPGITFSILRDEPDLRQREGSIPRLFAVHRSITQIDGHSATVVDQGHDVRHTPVHKLRMWLKRKIKMATANTEDNAVAGSV
jgi:hypothetical protein